MKTTDWVTVISLGAGVFCFLLYVYEAIVKIRAKASAPGLGSSPQVKAMVASPTATVQDLSDLFNAIAKLIDSLSKAGPALTSMVGAVLFFAIAAVSSGALRSAPPCTSAQQSQRSIATSPITNTSAPASNTAAPAS